MTHDEAEAIARKLKAMFADGMRSEEHDMDALCDFILSGDHKREIENAAFERAAKKADHLGELCDVDCTRLALTDPETGARECSLEVRGRDCLCTAQREQSNLIAVRIRSLIQPPAQKENGE